MIFVKNMLNGPYWVPHSTVPMSTPDMQFLLTLCAMSSTRPNRLAACLTANVSYCRSNITTFRDRQKQALQALDDHDALNKLKALLAASTTLPPSTFNKYVWKDYLFGAWLAISQKERGMMTPSGLWHDKEIYSQSPTWTRI